MAELYLLPCECGQKVRVGRAQAGQAVACACGKSLSVPTLRGLRDLETAPADQGAKAAGPAWSPWHGAAFSGGLAVAAIALLLCALNVWYYLGAEHYSEDHTDQVVQYATGELNELTSEQLLDEWRHLVEEGLGHVHTPIWVTAQQSAKVFRWRYIAFGSVALAGLIVSVGAVLLGRRR